MFNNKFTKFLKFNNSWQQYISLPYLIASSLWGQRSSLCEKKSKSEGAVGVEGND